MLMFVSPITWLVVRFGCLFTFLFCYFAFRMYFAFGLVFSVLVSNEYFFLFLLDFCFDLHTVHTTTPIGNDRIALRRGRELSSMFSSVRIRNARCVWKFIIYYTDSVLKIIFFSDSVSVFELMYSHICRFQCFVLCF